MEGGGKFDKSTYIGYLKIKNGGMKILPGKLDNKILKNRNNILGHLNKVLSGGKVLKDKNIDRYIKALGGKYIRNDMCISGDITNCKKGKNVSIGGAKKLIKLANDHDVINKFKRSAPVLYNKLYDNKKGGMNYTFKYKDVMYGGEYVEDKELDQLRIDINRTPDDVKLNILRQEIEELRR